MRRCAGKAHIHIPAVLTYASRCIGADNICIATATPPVRRYLASKQSLNTFPSQPGRAPTRATAKVKVKAKTSIFTLSHRTFDAIDHRYLAEKAYHVFPHHSVVSKSTLMPSFRILVSRNRSPALSPLKRTYARAAPHTTRQVVSILMCRHRVMQRRLRVFRFGGHESDGASFSFRYLHFLDG
jgi:hypothetical protein